MTEDEKRKMIDEFIAKNGVTKIPPQEAPDRNGWGKMKGKRSMKGRRK